MTIMPIRDVRLFVERGKDLGHRGHIDVPMGHRLAARRRFPASDIGPLRDRS
jgi:hypothetical protein